MDLKLIGISFVVFLVSIIAGVAWGTIEAWQHLSRGSAIGVTAFAVPTALLYGGLAIRVIRGLR